ncbi:hypothetical protein GTP44_23005 [Duganella sp. FT50W]|uniref:Uncharacterized protein n=1 Tax=Duganella lactea TaxID=2692173 RepID=A0A6L8MRW1_9BURK|nr:hypothetical protein [Duganella lactea]MYM37157.1 hypothetical protein [Duganella lactea]MYM84801.1 hypothetical protein [Duganella lactea]
MAIESVAPSSSTATQQTAPTRQPEQAKPVDRPAERVEQAPPPPPPQASVAPTVNTSGQRIGTTISTSA